MHRIYIVGDAMKIRENIENFERIKLNKVAKFSDESVGRERLEEPDKNLFYGR